MICDVCIHIIFLSPLNLGMQSHFDNFVCFVPVAPPVYPANLPRKSMFDSSFFVELLWEFKVTKIHENCSKLWSVFSGHVCGTYVSLPKVAFCQFVRLRFFSNCGGRWVQTIPNWKVDISACTRVPPATTSDFFWDSSFSGICLFGDCWRIGIPWDEKNTSKLKPPLTRENMFGDPFLHPHPTNKTPSFWFLEKKTCFAWQMEYLAYMWARRFRLLEFYRSLGRVLKGVDDLGQIDFTTWIYVFVSVFLTIFATI